MSEMTQQMQRSLRDPALLPLLLFVSVLAVLAVGLTLDPRVVPSPLIGKPVPGFALAPVKGRMLGLSSADLFVIDREGRIAYKQIGPVTPKLLDETLRPMIAKLRQ